MTVKTSTTARPKAEGFGALLREWRRARRVSQLALALSCGVSQRHLSFLESGRSRPSRDMVLHLATVLDVPLDRQNALLLAAGYAPVYGERLPGEPEMRAIEQAIGHVLGRHEPYPAMLVDRAYTLLRANEGFERTLCVLLGDDAVAAMMRGPVNVIELLLRPEALRPLLENWREVGAWSLRRLRAEALHELGTDEIAALIERLRAIDGVADLEREAHVDAPLPPTLTLRLRRDDVRLALFSMIVTVGTPLDVSLQNFRLELLFPADDVTASWLQSVSAV